MALRDLLKLLLALALLLGFPGVPTLLAQAAAAGPAPIEEREERVDERVAEKVAQRVCARGELATGAHRPSRRTPKLLIAGPARAKLPARDATRLALGISTTRLRC